jgi:hypothetical protein
LEGRSQKEEEEFYKWQTRERAGGKEEVEERDRRRKNLEIGKAEANRKSQREGGRKLEGRRQKEEEGSRSRERKNQGQITNERRVEVGGMRMNAKEGNISKQRNKPMERAGGKRLEWLWNSLLKFSSHRSHTHRMAP